MTSKTIGKYVPEPPPSGRGRHPRTRSRDDLEQIAQDLRNNPGAWTLVRQAGTKVRAQGFAYSIRKGRSVAFRPEGHYLAYTRGSDVYASYVGPRE